MQIKYTFMSGINLYTVYIQTSDLQVADSLFRCFRVWKVNECPHAFNLIMWNSIAFVIFAGVQVVGTEMKMAFWHEET